MKGWWSVLGTLRRWRWARRATAIGFLSLLILGRYDWFPWFKGSTTATTAFGFVPFADPLAALEVTLATREWHTSILLGAGWLVVLCAIVGPLFCGWLCPLGLLLDLNDSGRRRWLSRLAGPRARTRFVGAASALRWGVLGLVLGFSFVAQVPAFQSVSPINIVAWGAIFQPGPILLVLVGIAVVEWFVPRVWCRALCPLGALYSLIGRFGLLRIRINLAAAGKNPCGQCTHHCPMGIRIMEDYTMPGRSMIDHPDCTRCGDCVDECPTGVLRLGIGGGAKTASQGEAPHPA